MDINEQRFLFEQIVADKIRQSEMGVTELPLAALREFHDAVGYSPEQSCLMSFFLPGSEEGLYNFMVGAGSDDAAALELLEVYYYDSGYDSYESISGNRVLYGALYRDFYSGEALLCGYMSVDQYGKLYVQVAHRDCISADFRISLSPNTMGYQFISSDWSYSYRIWSDGDILFIAPTTIFIFDGLPS